MKTIAFLLMGATCSSLVSAYSAESDQNWFSPRRIIDLNLDGNADTAIIQALGASSDSLTMTLTLVVNGRSVWVEHWNSTYELVDPPEFKNGKADLDAYLRHALQNTLASVAVELFSVSDYLAMSQNVDSTLVRHPPQFQVSFSYGYETAVALYWDPKANEFRRLWACC